MLQCSELVRKEIIMAKRRKRSRKRRRRLGSTIRVRRLSGLGSLTRPSSLVGAAVPALVGGGAAAVTTVGIRQFEGAPPMLVQYSPWVGLGAAAVVAAVMYKTVSKPAGIGAFSGGLVITLGTVLMEYLAKIQLAKIGTDGLSAIVPEYAGTAGTGAIVMEPHASRGYGAGPLGSYGETVNLGSINPNVFGSPAFTV